MALTKEMNYDQRSNRGEGAGERVLRGRPIEAITLLALAILPRRPKPLDRQPNQRHRLVLGCCVLLFYIITKLSGGVKS
jgi:hypothetical protein